MVDQKTIGRGGQDDANEFEQRLAANPLDVNALNDLGTLRAGQKRFPEAIHLFVKATELDPSLAIVWANMGTAYNDSKQPELAEPCFERWASIEPNSAKAHRELGRARRKLGRLAEALQSLLRSAELAPEALVLLDVGMTYADLEREDEAERAYRKALEIDPDYAEAHNNLGVLLQEQGRAEEAIKHLREAVRLRPRAASHHSNLGVALAEIGKFEQAADCYRQSIKCDRKYALGHNNLGNALRSLGRPAEAILSLQEALRLRPDYAEAWNNIAIAYLNLGEAEAAIQRYNRAILLKPDYAEAHMNRAMAWLVLGKLDEGWTDYEWRWHFKTLRRRLPPGRRWDGGPLDGKRLLVIYEQGFGDTFQFVRYMTLLKHRGAYVIFEGQPVLKELLSRTAGIDEFVPRGQKLPKYDFYTGLLSLAGFFNTRLETIPAVIPYIFPSSELVEVWKGHVGRLNAFTVGIAWQGNPQHRGDRLRSVPVENFEPLARIKGVRLVSLQRGFGTEQIGRLDGKFSLETFDGVDENADGFQRTAAIIKNLDLVICVDTAVAHLAGAMGVPAWVAVSKAPDWRWLMDREDSPWYPSVQLFRQKKGEDWDDVFHRIARALGEAVKEKIASSAASAAPDPVRAAELLREGNVAIRDGKLLVAQRLMEDAIAADPLSADAHQDLGVALAKQGKLLRAISAFRRCLELKPDHATAHANLGLAFLQGSRIDEAISSFRRAIHLGGGTAEVHNNLGMALSRLPDPQSAIDSYRRALCLKPEYAAAHYNLSQALLITGNFEQGWLEHEWRYEPLGIKRPDSRPPRWTGISMPGSSILLYGEQGFGDSIQFARYVPIVKERSRAQIIVQCPKELVALFSTLSGADQVVAVGNPVPAHQAQAPLLSLPGILGTTLRNIAAPIQYLEPPAEDVARWESRLSDLRAYTVGIAWQGNKHHRGDRQRSVPLEIFEPVARVKGVRLVSLQRGFGTEQIERLGGKLAVETFDGVDEGSDGFVRTAAIVKNLDLVICVDTAVAHLAGAMGVPAWVALSAAPDWRWLQEREDSPWYPSIRLFRQRRRDDWQEVFARISQELQAASVSGGHSP